MLPENLSILKYVLILTFILQISPSPTVKTPPKKAVPSKAKKATKPTSPVASCKEGSPVKKKASPTTAKSPAPQSSPAKVKSAGKPLTPKIKSPTSKKAQEKEVDPDPVTNSQKESPKDSPRKKKNEPCIINSFIKTEASPKSATKLKNNSNESTERKPSPDKKPRNSLPAENCNENTKDKSKKVSTSSDCVLKKRGRPQGSKNKVKPADKTSLDTTSKDIKMISKITKEKSKDTKPSTPKVKDKSYIDTNSIIPESDTKVKRLAAILSAEVDHYTYNTDDDISEYEDYSFSRSTYNKLNRKNLSKEFDKTNKRSTEVNDSIKTEKESSISGWETVSDINESFPKKVEKKCDTDGNAKIRNSIDSVLSKIKTEKDSGTDVDTTVFKTSTPVIDRKKVNKNKQVKKSKEDSCADDEESEDDRVITINKEQSAAAKKLSASCKSAQKKRKWPQKSGKRNKANKAVRFASEDEESPKESDSEDDVKPEKRKKCTLIKKEVAPPSPPRRTARMASLNAKAVMHCMSEDARMPFYSHQKKRERSLVIRPESTIAKRHPDDDSDDDSDCDSVEIRRFSGKRKKEISSEKIKKVRKKRRGELDIQMDIRDMVVTKRMASLNASAIMAASYCVESRRRTPCNAASSSAESEVTNLNIKRKISYKSTKSKGSKSRSVITVQETTKKLKKAEGTQETEVEEHIIVKKKVKRHSGGTLDDTDDRDDDDDNVTDASELNHDEIIPKSPEDGGMIVESTITYITTQTDTSPQTVSVSGVSSYCISSGDRKTTTVVQQVERKSKTTTKCTAYSAAPPTAFIPPTHYVQVIDNITLFFQGYRKIHVYYIEA